MTMTPAESEVRRRIEEHGAITFAEFMDLALYWPRGGYYSSGDPIGPGGDYYTSPQVHPVFATLLAVQLFQMWQLLDRPDPFTVVELGAGNGILCRDLAACWDSLPIASSPPSLRYVCLDRRAAPGLEADAGVSRHQPPTASRFQTPRGVRPVQRVPGRLPSAPGDHDSRRAAGGLRRPWSTANWRCAWANPQHRPWRPACRRWTHQLAEGQTAEICLRLDGWAEQVAASLERGFVLTVDYGRPAADLYSPELRPRGTLTTYYRHTQLDAPLQSRRPAGHHRPGRLHLGQSTPDAAAAWTCSGWTPKRRFLRNLGLSRMQQRLAMLGQPQYAAQANRAGMLDLARPRRPGRLQSPVPGQGRGHAGPMGVQPLRRTQRH